MKISTIVGARPQFIKAAVVSRAIRDCNEGLQEAVIHTGQHYDDNMSRVFFEQMDMPVPTYHLGVGGGSHGVNTGKMLEKIEATLTKERPDYVLVYGDTDSTIAGALAAAKMNIPVAHVESGLRSYNRKMPEEINRVLTDHLSELLFTPSVQATRNLAKEGISSDKVKQVGDVMYDALLFYKDRSFCPNGSVFQDDFFLCTVHRAENTNDAQRLSAILSALNVIAKDRQVVIPLHPRTRNTISSGDYTVDNITFIEPVSYFEMLWLLQHSAMVITDSGGLQKEAYFMQKRCVTIRNETEWVELVDAGVNYLVGADHGKIIQTVATVQNIGFDNSSLLYGDGDAGEKIVKILMDTCR